MLSLFPQLLFLAPFAVFFIRIAAGFSLGYMAWKHWTVLENRVRVLSIIEGILGLLLLVGAYTQAVALIGFLILLASIFIKKYHVLPRSTLLLLALLSFSLILMGAGPFAFDLPL